MRGLDLADLVALAAEVSEIEAPKLLELLDTPEIGDLLEQAPSLRRPHEAAATHGSTPGSSPATRSTALSGPSSRPTPGGRSAWPSNGPSATAGSWPVPPTCCSGSSGRAPVPRPWPSEPSGVGRRS